MKTKLQLARTAVLLLFAVLSTTGAWAEDKAKGIVVWLSDGNKTEVLFTDMPEFTYADGVSFCLPLSSFERSRISFTMSESLSVSLMIISRCSLRLTGLSPERSRIISA